MNATIQTELDNLQFVPGGDLRGRVGWQTGAGLTAAELRLFYYTAGKGTRDTTVVDTCRWDSPGPAGGENFAFALPDGPYSFSGKLISLIWALELILEPAHHIARIEIVVSPTGHELDLHRYPLPPELDGTDKAKKWFQAGRSR